MTKTAKTYGTALYELARDEGCAGELLEQLEAVAELLKENPDYVRITSSPSLTKQERRDLLDEAFRGRVHVYLLNFLKLLSEKGDVGELPGCAREFRSLYNEDNGILEVTCVSAVALTADQRERLTEKLHASTGKTIRLTQVVDPGCLGGLRVEYDGMTLDGTVAGRIGHIRGSLKDLPI